MTAETWESTGGSVTDELAAIWETVKTTVSNVLDGDLDEVPYGDRPEVLIGAAFAVGFVTALILKRLGRR
jgi:hypothetical protein